MVVWGQWRRIRGEGGSEGSRPRWQNRAGAIALWFCPVPKTTVLPRTIFRFSAFFCFETKTLVFSVSKTTWPKSEEKHEFGVRWVGAPLQVCPPPKPKSNPPPLGWGWWINKNFGGGGSWWWWGGGVGVVDKQKFWWWLVVGWGWWGLSVSVADTTLKLTH